MVNSRFGMKRFMDRISASSGSGNSRVSPVTIEALRELSKEKLSKGEMASRAASCNCCSFDGNGASESALHYTTINMQKNLDMIFGKALHLQ